MYIDGGDGVTSFFLSQCVLSVTYQSCHSGERGTVVRSTVLSVVQAYMYDLLISCMPSSEVHIGLRY